MDRIEKFIEYLTKLKDDRGVMEDFKIICWGLISFFITINNPRFSHQ